VCEVSEFRVKAEKPVFAAKKSIDSPGACRRTSSKSFCVCLCCALLQLKLRDSESNRTGKRCTHFAKHLYMEAKRSHFARNEDVPDIDEPNSKRSCNTLLDATAASFASIEAISVILQETKSGHKLSHDSTKCETCTDANDDEDREWVTVKQKNWLAQVRSSWLLSFVPKGKSEYRIVQEAIDKRELILPDTLCSRRDIFQLVFGVVAHPSTHGNLTFCNIPNKDIPEVARVLHWLGFDEPKDTILNKIVYTQDVSTNDKFQLACTMHHDGLLEKCSKEWLHTPKETLPPDAPRMLSLYWRAQAIALEVKVSRAQVRVSKAKALIQKYRDTYEGDDSANCNDDCPRGCTGFSAEHGPVSLTETSDFANDVGELVASIETCLHEF
jgi:hypothetical protein